MKMLQRIWTDFLDRLGREIARSIPFGRSQSNLSAVGTPALRTKLEEIESSLEWEPFELGFSELSIVRIDRHEGPLGYLSIKREDDYSLAFSVDTSLDYETVEELMDIPKGTLAEGITVEATGKFPGDLTRVPGAVVGHVTRTWSEHKAPRVVMELRASQVTHILDAGTDEGRRFVTDWFISGPRSFRWTRLTTRERYERLVRTRNPIGQGADKIVVSRPPPAARPDENISWDHMLLTLASGVRLVASSVPEGHGPSWSKCLAVEYHQDVGAPPETMERDGVAEALGFLFGRQLLHVGSTTYDEIGQPLEEYGCSPWGRDAVETALDPDMPPFKVRREDTESTFNCILKEYLRRRSELALQDVVWTTWIARRMPLGFELPLYSSALERLMTAWFRSSGSKSKGVYMEKGAFDELTNESFAGIAPRLSGAAYGERIMRRMRGAFQMGVSDRFEVFFDEIGLAFGPGELAVIKARNGPAHGGGRNHMEPQQQLDLGRGYQVLLNRCLLRLLGHSGTYTDYSVRGHPETPLSEPIGIALGTVQGVGAGG